LSGYGFLVADDCLEGNAVCNTVTNCNRGFGFQSVATGEEFGPVEYVSSPGDPSDNAWFPASTANRTHTFAGTNGSLVDWYYRGAGSTPAAGTEHDASIDNTSGGISVVITPTAVLNATIDLCGQTMRSSGSSEPQFAHAAIPASIFAVLQADSTSNTVSDQSYTFLQTAKLRGLSNSTAAYLLAQTNIDALDSVEQLICSNEWTAASTLLSSLSPTNEQEELQMEVLAILLAGKLSQEESFTATLRRVVSYLDTEQVAALEAIADLDATGRRVPVLMAEAILGRNNWSVEAFEERQSNQGSISSNKLHVFPNPTAASFYLETSESIELLQVFDAFGQLKHQQNMQGSEGMLHVNLLDAEPGLYLVKARVASTGKVLSAVLVLVAN